MNKIALALHGGCGHASTFIKKNLSEHEKGLREALEIGYKILKKGGSALKAVEETVISLEDNYLFNAGRGSALNNNGEIEMDASIMDGKRLKAGAVSMVRTVKNPVILARNVMTKTNHVFLSGYGALEFAKTRDIIIEPESYFVTEHQFADFTHTKNTETLEQVKNKKMHGTVGAVALDKRGNLAAATSTGGTPNCLPGRIGDSCVIGAGCYANNATCAVSGTGDGEFLITGVVAHTISMLMELKNYSMQEACESVVKSRLAKVKGHIGVISVDLNGNVGIAFNTKVMKRAWINFKGETHVQIF